MVGRAWIRPRDIRLDAVGEVFIDLYAPVSMNRNQALGYEVLVRVKRSTEYPYAERFEVDLGWAQHPWTYDLTFGGGERYRAVDAIYGGELISGEVDRK